MHEQGLVASFAHIEAITDCDVLVDIPEFDVTKKKFRLCCENGGLYLNGIEPVQVPFPEPQVTHLDIHSGDKRLSPVHFLRRNGKFSQADPNNTGTLLRFQLSDLQTEQPSSSNQFYRLILQPEFAESFFHHHFACEKGALNSDLIRLDIANHKVIVARLIDNRAYWTIDCMDRVSYEEFFKITSAVIAVFGLVKGYMPLARCYILTFEDGTFANPTSFRFCKIRDTLKFTYPIVFTELKLLKISEIEKTRFAGKLEPFPTELFSTLANQILRNQELYNTILLILQAAQCPLESRNACYAVAMETICNFLYAQVGAERASAVVGDPQQWKEIKDDLLASLAGYQEKIDAGAYAKLRSRLVSNLNQATNADKLESVFKAWGMHLTELDIRVLGDRNLLLHGKGHQLLYWEPDHPSKSYHESLMIGLRCHLLISKLILTTIGYKGYTFNFYKLFHEILLGTCNEEYFEILA